MTSEHDAISVQLCLHAGLSAETAETLLDRLAERAPFSKQVIDDQAAEITRMKEVQQWVSVDDRLPDAGLMVLVYSPPQPGDWPDSIRVEFDCIDPDSDDLIWLNHSEHYEHYCCVAKGDSGVEWTGPSASAPYTHWMPLPAAPSAALAQEQS